MGESFLGLPNRFKIVDNLLESTYNPNHMLSAYQGYRLGTDYLNRSGGEEFAMTGPLITKSLIPDENIYYGKYGSLYGNDIGSYDNKYRYIYALHLYGGADTAIKLEGSRLIEITGSVTGSVTTDFDGNVTIDTSTNHNHDSLYLKLTGGTLTGGLVVGGTTCPSATNLYNLGTASLVWKTVYAKTVKADTFAGNSNTATKLETVRNITVTLSPSDVSSNNSGSVAFDGSSDITITVPSPYLPVNGGSLYGNLAIMGSITPYTNKYQNIGKIDCKWNYIYGSQIYGDSFYGNLYGNVFGGASFASKLSTARTIKINLKNSTEPSYNYGYNTFDGSSDITIDVNAPYLPISGGSIGGNILPTTNDVYYLGSNTHKFKGVYATNLYGNADTSTKLATARTLTIGKTGKVFDGSSNVSWSLAEIGAADANIVGSETGFKLSSDLVYSSGDVKEIWEMGTLTFYGGSDVAVTLVPGTYIIIARVAGNFLARSINVGIATGSSLGNVSPLSTSCTTIASTPMIVNSNGNVVAREGEFNHKIPAVTIQSFTANTVVVPYVRITPSPNWGGNTMYYSLSIRAVRIR